MRRLATLTLLLIVFVGCREPEPPGDSASWTDSARFVSAPDGDTLKVQSVKYGETTIRVAGIDTPERGQAYWRAARAHLVQFATDGELAISCYKTDQYGRLVCRVKREGSDLGESLIRAGLAWHFKRFENEQPPDERALYARLERAARESRIGLWQDPEPMPPEACRRARRAGDRCH